MAVAPAPGAVDAGAVLATVSSLRRLAGERIDEAKAVMEREVIAAAASVNQIFGSEDSRVRI